MHLLDARTAQIPMWPDFMRGLPNAFARSALFTSQNLRKGERRHLKRERIAALHGIEIHYSGEELRQDDEDVFLQVSHLARQHPLGDRVSFTAHAMLTELQWATNSPSYRRLVECLDRLSATSLSVTVTIGQGQIRENFTGSLVRKFRWRETAEGPAMRRWEVVMEPEIIALFGPTSYTRLQWSMRLSLPPLAKWLHSYYSTHADPMPISVARLHELTGSEIPAADVRKFKYRLRQALELLQERGFLVGFEIDRGNQVHVTRARAA